MEIISRKEAKERGLKKYYTGKPCKYGHIAERWTGNKVCTECRHTSPAYEKSGPRKKVKRKYEASEKGKARRKAYREEYKNTEAYKLSKAKWVLKKKLRRNPTEHEIRNRAELLSQKTCSRGHDVSGTNSRNKWGTCERCMIVDRLKKDIGVEPTEELVEAQLANLLIKREIKQINTPKL